MNPKAVWLVLLFVGLLGTQLRGAETTISASGGAVRTPLLLISARVFNAEDGSPHEGWSVLVTSNRITAVGPVSQMTVPADAERVELPDTTLLPGLMDLHSHLFLVFKR